MRILRVRMTIRRLMVGVAMAGLVFDCGLDWPRRQKQYRKLANNHLGYVMTFHHQHLKIRATEQELALIVWHERLFNKYDSAAKSPWLPVEPDPPEP